MSNADPRLVRDGSLVMVVGEAASLGVISAPNAPKTTADHVRWFTGIKAAIDGPMFEFCRTERNRSYDRFQCGKDRFRLYYPARNVDVASTDTADGSTLYVNGGVAGWTRGSGFPSGAMFAVQLYPTLVFDRAVTQGLSDRDNNKRAAIGVMENGEVFFAVHPSISMPAFAELLRAKGAKFAGYTDGGGSTALHLDANLDNTPEYSYNTRGRRIVSLVTMERKSTADRVVSAFSSAVLTASSSKAHIAIVVAVGIGAGALAMVAAKGA